MEIERTALLSVLATLKPAIASGATLEQLSHVWFDGKRASAFNDRLGIDVPFVSDFKGGSPGGLLAGLIGNSAAKTATMTVGKGGASIDLKSGGMKAKLALLDPATSLWAFPEGKHAYVAVLPALILALGQLLIGVGKDSSVPDQGGITMIGDEEGYINLFTTDAKTVSWVELSGKDSGLVLKDGERVVLPLAFVEQLVASFAKDSEILIAEDFVVAHNKKTDVRLFSRVIGVESPIDFYDSLKAHLPKGFAKNAIEIPERLELVIDRAMVLLDKPTDVLSVSIDGDKMIVDARTPQGEFNEVVPLLKKHPKIETGLTPSLVKRVLPQVTSMLLTDSAALFLGEGTYVHLISPIKD